MRERIIKFFGKNLSPIVWMLFLVLYTQARFIFHIFDLTGLPLSYKMVYHVIFFVPLGIFLWRREFSIRNVTTILLLLALIPEGFQYYLSKSVQLGAHLLDFSFNLGGGCLGICVGMLWTLRELRTR